MNSDWQSQVELERQWLRDLREDIPAMAGNIADDVTDALEREIEGDTEDGFIWDFAEGTQHSWLLSLSMQFEERMEKQVLSRLQQRAERLREALGKDAPLFDSGAAELDSLRKSLHLVGRLRPHLQRVMDRAEPGILRLLARAVNDDLDEMEAQWKSDGQRLQESFQQERQAIRSELTKAAEEMIQRLRLFYQQEMRL